MEARGSGGRHHGPAHLFQARNQGRPRLAGQVQKRGAVYFRHKQGMAGPHRSQIQKRQHGIVLIHPGAGDLSLDDTAENAVTHSISPASQRLSSS